MFTARRGRGVGGPGTFALPTVGADGDCRVVAVGVRDLGELVTEHADVAGGGVGSCVAGLQM